MKAIAVLCAVLALAVAAEAVCSNNCNGHGTCSNDRCVCTTNWKGEDCSIFDQALNSGEIARDAVEENQWKYYNHHVGQAGGQLIWTVNQTAGASEDPFDADPDADLYIQFGEYPRNTLGGYIVRDVSVNQYVTLTLDNVNAGTYYAGVYGYTAVRYNISVKEVSGCPNNCWSHGECVNGACRCYNGYGGINCENEYKNLPAGTTLVGQVAQSKWIYYYTDISAAGSALTYTMSQIGGAANSDCDMYLAFNRVPTLFNWDMANVSLGSVSTIKTSSSEVGRYNLGIYGYTACSFQVSLTSTAGESACPNSCSLHGTCRGGVCFCQSGYSGESCEWREAPLTLATPVSGYVGKNSWNYYNFRVLTENSITVAIHQNSASEDCDLYVRANDKPTRFEFDYVDLSLLQDYYISIREPGNEEWYIGVYGWEECTYSLVIDERIMCGCPETNAHGKCAEGSAVCVCDAGWSGDDCSTRLNVLTNLFPVSSSVRKYEWKYYTFLASNSSTGVISLKERSTTGLLWLFVSFTESPTLSSYDLSDKKTTALHEIQIFVPTSQTRTINVGVYGNPYGIQDNVDLSFDLVAWAANF